MPAIETDLERSLANEMIPALASVSRWQKETYDTFTLAL